MKTAVVKDGKIIIQDMSIPQLNNRKGAIVKVLGSGLCGSDIVKLRENLVPDGTVLGHEIVGEIEEINSDSNFKIGDCIVSSHHIPCGQCVYCKSGNVSMCKHFKNTNLEPGGFSEYIYLSEEHLLNVAYLKPQNLSNDEAAFYEPLACCIRAVKRCSLKQGDIAAVIGLGSIGIIMAQALKAFGIQVIGLDLIDERVDIVKSKGLDAINSKNSSFTVDYIKNLTGGYGVDAVFMTSGADKAINSAFSIIRNGGKILVFSSTPGNTGYPNNEVYYRELTILGSYSPSPEDLRDSLNLLKDKKVDVKGISTIYDIENIQKAFDDTIKNEIMKAYIKIS